MEDGHSLIPIIAVLFVVAMAAIVLVAVRFVKPRREIDDDFFGPREVQPTQPDIEDQPPALPAGHPNLKSTMLDTTLTTIVTKSPDDDESIPVNGSGKRHHVCRACGQVDDPALVEVEDWLQVKTLTGRIRARRNVRDPIEPGRALYAERFLCRSCAKIASHLNDAFIAALDLERKRATAGFDAREQKWEREGLLAAVKREIDLEAERYADEQDALKREDTRRRARKADL
jgi:hypothetical protein